MSDRSQLVSEIRRFNRFYTRTLGLLEETLNDTDFTLTEARVLFELGAGETSATDICGNLNLDAAYLARIVKKLTKAGLLASGIAADDRRRKTLALTAEGKVALAGLKDAASRDVAELIAPLGKAAQTRLSTAMRTIELLLSGEKAEPKVTLRPHAIGDVAWVVERQCRLYAEEYGWNGEYEALACEIVAAFIRNFKPDKEFCWIAELDGVRAGAVFLVQKSETEGQLRLLHVERAARGMGVGSSLVAECIAAARRAGYRRLVLWTNSPLVDARRIYERAGFTLVEEDGHHSFGKDLVGQNWELVL
mgnify:CR=1 FL=1